MANFKYFADVNGATVELVNVYHDGMTNATFTILTKINEVRATYGFKPLSKYEFETPAEWRREFKRVMADYRANVCPW